MRRDFPSSLTALIFPLWSSTITLAIDKPIPEPPVAEFLSSSNLWNSLQKAPYSHHPSHPHNSDNSHTFLSFFLDFTIFSAYFCASSCFTEAIFPSFVSVTSIFWSNTTEKTASHKGFPLSSPLVCHFSSSLVWIPLHPVYACSPVPVEIPLHFPPAFEEAGLLFP